MDLATNQLGPIELEDYIFPDWMYKDLNLGEEVDQLLDEAEKEKVPTAIGFHDSIGWFVLQTAGQGPILAWQEKDKS